jgi:cytochrome c oxidase subunit 3
VTQSAMTSETSSQMEEISRADQETQTLGMWIFLAGEVMFFGAVFTTYIIYRHLYPSVFAEASRHLDIVIGSLNTFILLTSSLCMALAVNAIQRDKRKLLTLFLAATIILGLIFLGLKALEYSHEFEQNLFPGGNFLYSGKNPENARLFFSLYFTMTGLHAAHMIVGIILLSTLLIRSVRKQFTSLRYTPVETIGLFWHFIDIVWIFIFPLLYLIDRF